jgi:hypothetical protein
MILDMSGVTPVTTSRGVLPSTMNKLPDVLDLTSHGHLVQ